MSAKVRVTASILSPQQQKEDIKISQEEKYISNVPKSQGAQTMDFEKDHSFLPWKRPGTGECSGMGFAWQRAFPLHGIVTLLKLSETLHGSGCQRAGPGLERHHALLQRSRVGGAKTQALR